MNQQVKVDYIANSYRHYQGEEVIFYTRLRVPANTVIKDQVIVRIYLPPGLQVKEKHGPAGQGEAWLYEDDVTAKHIVNQADRVKYQVVFWQFEGDAINPDQDYEYQIETQIASTKNLLFVKSENGQGPGRRRYDSLLLKSWAEVEILGAAQSTCSSSIIQIQVLLKARVSKNLPGIYHHESQEFLWRYLMLFDKWWLQIEALLAHLPYYFDVHMAPSEDFLAWLASWVGLIWDSRLSTRRQQALLLEMIKLYRKRGTKQGLQRYLQICLEVADDEVERRIQITENPVGNFVLGAEATDLGNNLIVGQMDGERCKFIVSLDWPQPDQKLDEMIIREIIEAWKPAHTVYELFLQGPYR